jgi:hypothetical protein
MKVSFDFDHTLSRPQVQEYARELIERGIEVWIVTSRFGDIKKYNDFFDTTVFMTLNHDDLWEVVKDLGIPKERVIFMNMEPKENYLKDKGFAWHLDDDWGVLMPIQKIAKIPAINANNAAFKHKCDRILNK